MNLNAFAKKTINKIKKTTYRMGENTYKWSDWQGINLQNKQTAYAAQLKKKTQKIGRRSK